CLVSLRHSYALLFFSLHSSRSLFVLHSFPTRRSSDLPRRTSGRSSPRRSPRRSCTPSSASPDTGCRGTGPWQQRRLSHRNCRRRDRKSTRLNSSHVSISYAVFCLKKKKKKQYITRLIL